MGTGKRICDEIGDGVWFESGVFDMSRNVLGMMGWTVFAPPPFALWDDFGIIRYATK